MKHSIYAIALVCALFANTAKGQSGNLVAGYHFGVVQPILAINKGDVNYFYETDFYAIGFPMGITLNTPGKVKFDLEFVPLFKPYADTDKPYEVHLLFHPGFLFPLGGGFTFGMRLAFETGVGQFGLTPLLNKGFSIGDGTVFFLELVAPGRFGPEKNSGYTQIFGLHAGLGF
ncbi:MAG: hypothetical protein KBF37_08475 [Saprospiraceae bacterium]|mgnify:CR=1 FL=1|jgi:hypothetical protein|nr:hypothetical protein [Saprospiraceae bacterium]MBP9210339.1 hypothetical protein [Saprospiraceae bacterium]MBV6474036.1 hypothetical protein [Saprospiraceae bacterium]